MNAAPFPVVLVHGITDTSAKMRHIANYLQQQGRTVYSVDLIPSCGIAALEVLATQLAMFIDKVIPPDAPFDLVAFSMGGLISRYYLHRLVNIDRIAHFVTLSTPHHGTIAAYFSQKPGCQQMRPGSRFLVDLNQDVEQLDRVKFTSIWTPFDLIILPASSSRLPFGREIILPIAAHPLMVWHQDAIVAVEKSLRE